MTKKDVIDLLNTDIDQPFIIEILIGISMIVTPIILAINQGFVDPTIITAILSGVLVIIYAISAYLTKHRQMAQASTKERFYKKLNARMNETFIIQVIFGAAMAIVGVINLIQLGLDYSFIMTIVSGVLLLVYSVYYYRMRLQLKELGEKGTTEYDQKAAVKINETFIIQLIFGCAMVGAALITLLSYGFDMNILMTLISGGMLIAYSIYYYRLNLRLHK
ncbi:MAG: hypothetical protein ACTSQI_00315 [Candidatus Helarchaeota archaeon]